ncbi:hypothetical protein CF8_0113 [Aeromonas phage CF8]|nr:hypothetical protein CF8_0113 [Aeromonas phage CF8]
MIDMAINGERLTADELNTLLDKGTHVSVLNTDITGPGYISNITASVYLDSCRMEDTIAVLLDNDHNRVINSQINNGGVRFVNVVSGYAYTQQTSCYRSHGVSCQ